MSPERTSRSINHKQPRPLTGKKPLPLRFEGRDDHGSIEILREVSGGDSDVPSCVPPLPPLIVREGARRDSEDRLPPLRMLLSFIGEQFENERFPRTGGSGNNDVVSVTDGPNRLLLP